MDSRVRDALDKKIADVSRMPQVKRISDSLGDDVTPHSMLVGMLYNSFHYQTRRICGRDPTDEETEEFIEMLKHALD